MQKIKVNGNKNINHKQIKAKIGLTNKTNHSVFYLEGSAFITPNSDFEDFHEIINSVESSCRRSIKKKLLKSANFDTNFIMNFDVCSDRMKKDKSTYLYFQYHFKQKDNLNIGVLDVKKYNEPFFIDLLDDIKNELNSYDITISKTKKLNETC